MLRVDSTGKWIGDVEEDVEVMPLRMAVGMAWEEWAAGLYPDMFWQPGELCRDGVFGTPDGMSPESENGGRGVLVEEFKCTWKSSRHDILTRWMWIRQGMGYCAMLGTRWVRYHVLYVNGNYRPSSPVYYTHLVEFTDKEIEQGWKLVLRNKGKAKSE